MLVKRKNADYRHFLLFLQCLISPRFVKYRDCLVKGYIIPLNPLPNDKILDWSKFKAFADDNLK